VTGLPWASVIATVQGEPLDRLQRMLESLSAQKAEGPVELIIAAPVRDHAALRALEPRGAVTSIAIIDNPEGARSAGLNRAMRHASADIVHRVDARSMLTRDHLARCDARLRTDSHVGIVGGRQRPVALTGRSWSRGLVRGLANPLALGAPAYRRPGASGDVDTVYLGAFRRAELVAFGGYDERLEANEDFEVCQRYRAAGAGVWLEAGLVVDYEARTRLRDVWRQYDAFGRAKVRYWRLHRQRPNRRQWVGLGAPLVAAGAALSLSGHPRALLAAGGITAAAALAVDHLVADVPAGSPSSGDAPVTGTERLAAGAASLLIPAAWAVGAYREFLSRR
jgi:hypothetical protein